MTARTAVLNMQQPGVGHSNKNSGHVVLATQHKRDGRTGDPRRVEGQTTNPTSFPAVFSTDYWGGGGGGDT